MPAGLQCFDENGNITFDATYRVMRIIDGVRLENGVSGSRVDDRLKQGGWVSFLPDLTSGDSFISGGVIIPQFSIDPGAGMLTWTYAAKHNTQFDIWQDHTCFTARLDASGALPPRLLA